MPGGKTRAGQSSHSALGSRGPQQAHSRLLEGQARRQNRRGQARLQGRQKQEVLSAPKATSDPSLSHAVQVATHPPCPVHGCPPLSPCQAPGGGAAALSEATSHEKPNLESKGETEGSWPSRLWVSRALSSGPVLFVLSPHIPPCPQDPPSVLSWVLRTSHRGHVPCVSQWCWAAILRHTHHCPPDPGHKGHGNQGEAQVSLEDNPRVPETKVRQSSPCSGQPFTHLS